MLPKCLTAMSYVARSIPLGESFDSNDHNVLDVSLWKYAPWHKLLWGEFCISRSQGALFNFPVFKKNSNQKSVSQKCNLMFPIVPFGSLIRFFELTLVFNTLQLSTQNTWETCETSSCRSVGAWGRLSPAESRPMPKPLQFGWQDHGDRRDLFGTISARSFHWRLEGSDKKGMHERTDNLVDLVVTV